MPRFSVSFDPATDTVDSVCEAVERLFSLFDVTQTAAAAAQVAGAPIPSPAATLAGQTAPTQQAQATTLQTAAAGAADVDATGLRWDARIHSTPAKKNADGTWRGKRNQDAALVAQVRAEQQGGAVQQSTPPAAPPAPPAAPAAPVTPPTPPAPPVAPPAPPAPTPSAYEQLVRLLSANTFSEANPTGRITDAWVQQALTAYSVPGGLIQNCADWPAENLQAIIAGIKTSLGQ